MQINHDEIIKASEREAYTIADSREADEIKQYISVSALDEAETEFAELLKQIADADLRERLDRAAGRISFVYERFGFAQGYIADRLLAQQ